VSARTTRHIPASRATAAPNRETSHAMRRAANRKIATGSVAETTLRKDEATKIPRRVPLAVNESGGRRLSQSQAHARPPKELDAITMPANQRKGGGALLGRPGAANK